MEYSVRSTVLRWQMMTDDTIVIVIVGAPDGAPIKHLLESLRANWRTVNTEVKPKIYSRLCLHKVYNLFQ
jgi:hypothetical protein